MMIRNQRRPYTQNQQPEKPSITVTNLADASEESLKALIVDSLKALSRNIDELKHSIKEIEEKLDYLDSRQRKTENDVEKFNAKSRAAEIDLNSFRSELDVLKRDDSHHTYSYNSQENMDRPIMPGTGFSCVTPNYLKNRQR